ncbi:RidA family protein [Sphingomonas lenta]|uniref:Enamine deaminase RidA n=1 Tax=Sphingomonas lenta TaxID=1141887 RepID=A0A2A2SC70_9SPHN|nr:RidA family protein [Sphingomonas lenta]PAX06772.1 enamine deaminase RidA [Sphingomonas lenta]
MSAHRVLLPPGWPRPRGYSNGVLAEGRTVWTGGIIGWDEQERWVDRDLPGQFRRILRSTLAILAEAGAGPEHVVRMTWYVVDRRDYLDNLPAIGAAYREAMGRNYPAMAVVQVAGLMEAEARIEIETTAVIP